jgi:hypothetical protein
MIKKSQILGTIKSQIAHYEDAIEREDHDDIGKIPSCSFCSVYRFNGWAPDETSTCGDCPNKCGCLTGSCSSWPSTFTYNYYYDIGVAEKNSKRRIAVLEDWYEMIDVLWVNEIKIDDIIELHREAHILNGFKL